MIKTAIIQYRPDPAKDYGWGMTIKFKASPTPGESVTLFAKADHPDAAGLVKGASVLYEVTEDGKAKFVAVGVAVGTVAPTPAHTSHLQSTRPDLPALIAGYVEVWRSLDQLEIKDETVQANAAATIFIAWTR